MVILVPAVQHVHCWQDPAHLKNVAKR